MHNAQTLIEHGKGGAKTPSAAFQHLEVVLAEDVERVEAALRRAYAMRTGQNALPMPGFGDDEE